ncbi:hypothetical protein ACLQ2R_21290 [Streptosporangium sp. DT93]|uniref:hypothetical protein n=1 Tax=Streptosporangium sp. DT93 TaxID=3393428 RepID=UPI003CF4BAB6
MSDGHGPAPGASGAPDPSGAPGTSGARDTPSAPAPPGVPGAPGASGAPGAPGASGATGVPGATGAPGAFAAPGAGPAPQVPPGPWPPYDEAPAPQWPYAPSPYGARTPPPATHTGIIPLRPLGLGDILDGATKLIRSNRRSVLGLSAVAATLSALTQVLFMDPIDLSVLAQDPAGDQELASFGEPAPAFGSLLGDTLLSYGVEFVVITLLTGMLTAILGRAVFGGTMTVGEAWARTRGRVPTLFGLVFAVLLLVLVPLLLTMGLIAAIGAAGAGPATTALVGVLAVPALLAGLAFLTTRLALAPSIAVLERRGIAGSLRRSWQLVSGGFWRTLGILLLTWLIALLVGQVLGLPFVLAGTLVGALGDFPASQITATVLITVGVTVGAAIAHPLRAGVNGLLYADRRMRAEAFDLELQTAALEQRRQGREQPPSDDLWNPSLTPGLFAGQARPARGAS